MRCPPPFEITARGSRGNTLGTGKENERRSREEGRRKRELTRGRAERAKVRRAMEATLLATAMKIVTYANQHKDHIPPITTQATNPFPYKINLDQKETGWVPKMRIY